MATLLPDSNDPAQSLRELLDYATRRMGQARKIDPFGGFPRPVLEANSRFQGTIALSPFVLVPATLVVALVTRGPFLWALAAVTAVVLGCSIAIVRRANRHVARWRSEGVVVAGALVMANEKILRPDAQSDYPGVIVFSFDADLGCDADGLSSLAERLFDLKGADASTLPKDLREISATLTSERPVWERIKVPRDSCGNYKTWMSGILFERDRLPNGFVDRRIWICLVHPVLTRSTTTLMPLELWWRPDLEALSSSLGGVSSRAEDA